MMTLLNFACRLHASLSTISILSRSCSLCYSRCLTWLYRGRASGGHSAAVSSACWYAVDSGLFFTGGMDRRLLAWDSNRFEVVEDIKLTGKVRVVCLLAEHRVRFQGFTSHFLRGDHPESSLALSRRSMV